MSRSKFPAFPISRPRRLRTSANLRAMVRETEINPNDFIYPLFVRHGKNIQHRAAGYS